MGGYSQIAAELRLIKFAIDTGIEYSFLHYLQNSDLPIKRHEEIIRFFEESREKEFVNIVFGWNERLWRAKYCNLFCQNRWAKTHKFLRALNLLGVKIQKMLKLSINDDIQMYVGSAIFSITLPCAKYIANKEKEIRHRFKWSYCGDEIFLPTIIMNSPYRDNLIYLDNGQTSNALLLDWNKPHRHNSPRLWRGDDFDEIIAKSKNYCYARKFIGEIDMDIVHKVEQEFS